ncbi:hypothetical protein AAY473_022705, partial [Plecturocebus cupreus]
MIYLPGPIQHLYLAILTRVSLLSSRLECNGLISAHFNLRLLSSSDSPASPSQRWGFTVLARLVSNSETFGDPAASASKSAGISVGAAAVEGQDLLLEQVHQPLQQTLTPVAQAGVQCHGLHSLQPSPLKFKISLCCPGWSAVVWSWLTAASAFQALVDHPTSASQ